VFQRFLLSEMRDNTEIYSKLAIDGGMNAGQAGWLSVNFMNTASTAFKYSAYLTFVAFGFVVGFLGYLLRKQDEKNRADRGGISAN
jgi:hypothetical protein